MKKYLFIFICGIFLLMTACSNNNVADNSLQESETYQLQDKEIIESQKYYSIYKNNITSVTYDVFNSDGKIVFSETTESPLEMNMVNDYIVDIAKGMGTGITQHTYYDAEKDAFSDEFTYVICSQNDMVAYIDVPPEKSFENRMVIVQNIFQKEVFYKEFCLDFSDIDTPVTEAEFSEDGKSLMITYLSGENQTQISETLNLA